MSKFVGLVGALVAAILLWSGHRWWAVAAIATVVVQLFLRDVPRVDILADSAGTGLLVFALAGSAWLAIIIAALDIVLSEICKNRIAQTFHQIHADLLAGSQLTPEQIIMIHTLGHEDDTIEDRS